MDKKRKRNEIEVSHNLDALLDELLLEIAGHLFSFRAVFRLAICNKRLYNLLIEANYKNLFLYKNFCLDFFSDSKPILKNWTNQECQHLWQSLKLNRDVGWTPVFEIGISYKTLGSVVESDAEYCSSCSSTLEKTILNFSTIPNEAKKQFHISSGVLEISFCPKTCLPSCTFQRKESVKLSAAAGHIGYIKEWTSYSSFILEKFYGKEWILCTRLISSDDIPKLGGTNTQFEGNCRKCKGKMNLLFRDLLRKNRRVLYKYVVLQCPRHPEVVDCNIY